jgi:hypothetical protein
VADTPTTTPTIPVYGQTSTAPTTSTASAPTTTASSSSGSFPQTNADPTASSILAAYNAGGNATQQQFFAAYNITSSEDQPMYQYQTGQSIPSGFKVGDLNRNALDLIQFMTQSETDRQDTEDLMVDSGMLASSAATGIASNTTAVAAFKDVLQQASQDGVDAFTWLNTNGGGTAGLSNQIAVNKTASETEAAKPVTAEVSPNATIAASINSAFNQALGFAPTDQQTNDFISQIQGQETSEYAAPQQEAQQQVTQADDEQSALNKLGPDGVDTVLSAYQAAVSGSKLPGAGTNQGPTTGNLSPTPGTPAVPSHTVQVPVTKTVEENRQSLGNLNINSAISQLQTGAPTGTDTRVAVQVPNGTRPEQVGGKAATAPTPGGPAYGGIYALTSAEWTKAQSLSPTLKAYVSSDSKAIAPGGASAGMQQTAAQTLLLNEYQTNGGSWSAAVTTLASGSPVNKVEGSHLSTFATNIANDVNTQIAGIQSQINATGTTTKIAGPTSSTDIDAEAAQAAKEADPAGYYAANYASWGSQLSKVLYGTPLTNEETTADTFTGPVGSESALATPASAPAPATSAAG